MKELVVLGILRQQTPDKHKTLDWRSDGNNYDHQSDKILLNTSDLLERFRNVGKVRLCVSECSFNGLLMEVCTLDQDKMTDQLDVNTAAVEVGDGCRVRVKAEQKPCTHTAEESSPRHAMEAED